MPHVDFSVLVGIRLFHSVSRSMYLQEECSFVDTSLQQSEGLVLHEELTTMAEVFKELARDGRLFWFVFSEDYDDIFFECFVASAYPGLFQTLFSRLISCQLVTFFKGRLVSQARPFPFPQ